MAVPINSAPKAGASRHLLGPRKRPTSANARSRTRFLEQQGMPKQRDKQHWSVTYSGIHSTGVPLEDLIHAAALLSSALHLREEYMTISEQSFSPTVAEYLSSIKLPERKIIANEDELEAMKLKIQPSEAERYITNMTATSSLETIRFEPEDGDEFIEDLPVRHHTTESTTMFKPADRAARMSYASTDDEFEDMGEEATEVKEDPWACPTPPDRNFVFEWYHGIVKVYANRTDQELGSPIQYEQISWSRYVEDMTLLGITMADGPLKSFCFRRLSFLASKFKMHVLLNELHEHALQKAVPHRDFYNVTKVDTHIHAASSMNQKHLLRFIKQTLRTSGDEVVSMTNGKPATLKSVFEDMKLDAYDLNVDILDVHAFGRKLKPRLHYKELMDEFNPEYARDRNTFERFDKFNAKYNPVGESRLREVFLKTDNYMNGVYFANIIKEVIHELKLNKHTYIEPRISIYCKNKSEWSKLAAWAIRNNVHSHHVRWLVQVPRLYDIYRVNGILKNFQEFLSNLFDPLFEVSINPSSNPELHKFLAQLIGFDSVDDESKPENPHLWEGMKAPDNWVDEENPPYNYYLYYMFTNMATLNQIRKEQGMNTFVLRPHCGEAGPGTHLCASFLLSENISHGLMLRKHPVFQYLYYLAQISIAMSPLSNNSLFLRYHRNPLPDFFSKGLRVTLSTDDPLQFHYTVEPLMEEYSIAAQAWKLSSCDMCELARNSVTMSGFPHELKCHWLGPDYEREGPAGNDITRTNIPNVRVHYRYETLLDELDNIFRIAAKHPSNVHLLAPSGPTATSGIFLRPA